jgi:hypothetical protein
MSNKRVILRTDVGEDYHQKFKQKYGVRHMKDRLRKLIIADVEGSLIISSTNKNKHG